MLAVIIIALICGFVPIIEVEYQSTEFLKYEAQSYVQKGHRDILPPSAILSPFAFSTNLDEIQQALNWAYPPGGTAPEYYPIGHVAVKNTDSIPGMFTVQITFDSGDKEFIEDFVLELESGETEEIEKSANLNYDKDIWSWKYEVTPDTKLVSHFEKVPLFEYLLSQFQA